jgi:ubiquitin thioesterase OTU1
LKTVVADTILNNPFEYNEVILGKPIDEYCQWILKPSSWGGAIELAIFSDNYKSEICSIDVANVRVDRFGEGKGYSRRCFVIYSGIHYDAVVVSPVEDAPWDFDMTSFEVAENADEILAAALKLAEAWKRSKKFTDLANFTLKCGLCFKVSLESHDCDFLYIFKVSDGQ